jgi:outer membrane receptor protein involved in Fe transport
LEVEASHSFTKHLFANVNYTFVDSRITLLPEQQTVQTSLERPLAGQSKNLVNLMADYRLGGFSTRLLFNYFGDRISDVGSNDAPDIIEQGRGSLDLVFSQRLRGFTIRLNLENLTDSRYVFTQGVEDQRLFKLGRIAAVSVGYSLF